jgi:pimeloyl-ACP methyl ester carboxylesterase
VHYKRLGTISGPPAAFIHGLGGTMDFWMPLIATLQLEASHDLHVYDFEGHGLSPTSPLSTLSIRSLAEDLYDLLEYASVSQRVIVFGHSMGAHVATTFARSHPAMVQKLILLGPPPQPLPKAVSSRMYRIADAIRHRGIDADVDSVVSSSTSSATKAGNPLAIAAMRLSMLSQDPEGYAKACYAIAGTVKEPVEYASIPAKEILVVTGSDDKVSPPNWCEQIVAKNADQNAKGVVLHNVGHWHVFEDVNGVKDAVAGFL